MAEMTARDIAMYIQRPDEPLTAAVDRFRNWEKTGVIQSEGDQNPGTGRKKLYSPPTVLRAVLLQTLIDTFGSSAVSLSELIREFGALIGNASWLEESELLVLSRPRGAPRFKIKAIKPGQLRNYISSSSTDVHVVIDVKRLFERIDHDWRNKFYMSPAFQRALKQIEKRFGTGSVMKLAKTKPKS